MSHAALSVVRSVFTIPKKEDDWGRTNIFHTYTKIGDVSNKVSIDGGSCMNVVSKGAVTQMNLKPEPHPQPYKVAWVDNISMSLTERCLVPVMLGAYQDHIWCDVLPMIVAHILLGRPWLYDQDMTYYGRANTYVFQHKGKKIVLTPSPPRNARPSHSKESCPPIEQKKPLHVLN
ncbi:hypothetical protein CFOL_v3_12224 [Cephalotus follicularis]|uniref:Uncharacterized protein n=1 Tax=Cephalotus follicularis TaxID=3775 RepID=A0A1Q3BL43_CEPFO|nr:hypothetical protein CFOL_v3_12224 [Cephalotus follicularis]